MYFKIYRAQRTWLDKCLKASVWEDLSTSDMVNGLKYWLIINDSAFIILSDTVKVIELQNSLLETWKFFSRFLKTLTGDNKYSLISREKWMQTIQMHLSEKQKIFSEFFCGFFESELNFEHFQKKDDAHSLCISEITDHGKRA